MKTNLHSDALYRVLAANYKVLVEAQSPEPLLRDYSDLLRFLRSSKARFEPQDLAGKAAPPKDSDYANLNSVMQMSLEELEARIEDPRTPRKMLEFVAMNRFSVPKGSMRSFSNRVMLRDKLLTLVRNERAHQTIGNMARSESSQGFSASDHSVERDSTVSEANPDK